MYTYTHMYGYTRKACIQTQAWTHTHIHVHACTHTHSQEYPHSQEDAGKDWVESFPKYLQVSVPAIHILGTEKQGWDGGK